MWLMVLSALSFCQEHPAMPLPKVRHQGEHCGSSPCNHCNLAVIPYTPVFPASSAEQPKISIPQRPLLQIIYARGPLARYLKLGVAHAPGIPGTILPPPRVTIPTCTTARAWRTCRDAYRGRHSQRMRNTQFYSSGKMPIQLGFFSAIILFHAGQTVVRVSEAELPSGTKLWPEADLTLKLSWGIWLAKGVLMYLI